ncbi:MAG TPA: response regulator [Candidatus Binatia bacterium]|jgi:two-component system cell cycle response regulator|nr:response regulator [Candidatus Binatia bacterium]
MKKVLTIDDSKVVRSMVTRHLQPYGCEVVEATNGQEGVEAAKLHQPDLILLDVTMPVMDGKQALAAIRADAATKALPVIMLTAESGRELVVEIVKLGVNGYIVKPFQKESFEKEVSKILGAPSATPPAPAGPPLDRHTVLVVDGDEAILASARQALAGSMQVLTATGAEALERWTSARPGVVLVNVATAGDETIGKLRGLGPSAFVGMAARGDMGAHDAAKKAGCHTVLDSPCQPLEMLDGILVATAAVATVEDQVQTLLGTRDGCVVLNLPDPRSKVFGKVLPSLTKRLRALGAEGGTKLVVDMDNVTESNADVVKSVVAIVTEATTAGLRTAIAVSSASVVESLKQIAETQNRLFPSRDAAREGLK